jgi:beta-1,4-mannosyltransferase
MHSHPRIYVYPNVAREVMGSNNPYIDNLKKALYQNECRVNMSVSKYAFLDLIINGFRTDMIVLNWVENIPSRRFGIIQTLVFVLYLYILKLSKVQIVWIRHNKVSHERHRFAIKQKLVRMLERHSDHIVSHSSESDIRYFQKTIFIAHPVNPDFSKLLPAVIDKNLSIDFLIWGSIIPYKGILEFLEFISSNAAFSGFKIHIAGKCNNMQYWNQMNEVKGQNVTLINEFQDDEKLKELFSKTRFILFTYRNESVLSSGVLTDSLVAGKRIIAPDFGAFKDMAANGFASVYSNFSDIERIYLENQNKHQLDPMKIAQYFSENSWFKMGSKLKELTHRPDRAYYKAHIQ